VVIHPTNDLSLNFIYISGEYFYYETMSFKTCCLNIFFGGSVRTPSTSFVGCTQIFYDVKTSSHFLHNEYEYIIYKQVEKPYGAPIEPKFSLHTELC